MTSFIYFCVFFTILVSLMFIVKFVNLFMN